MAESDCLFLNAKRTIVVQIATEPLCQFRQNCHTCTDVYVSFFISHSMRNVELTFARLYSVSFMCFLEVKPSAFQTLLGTNYRTSVDQISQMRLDALTLTATTAILQYNSMPLSGIAFGYSNSSSLFRCTIGSKGWMF